MLKSLNIINYEAISNLSIDLKRFTVILGPSNAGKSSIIRALHTLVNSKRGSAMISTGKPYALVSAVTTEGHEISWRRTRSGSVSYTFGEESYTKIGTTVPEEVSKALKMNPIETPTAEIDFCFGLQMKSPLFISDTGPTRFRLLSLLAGTDILSNAIAEANTQKRDLQTQLRTLSYTEEALVTTETELINNTSALASVEAALLIAEKFQSATSLVATGTTVLQDYVKPIELDLPAAASTLDSMEKLLALLETGYYIQSNQRSDQKPPDLNPDLNRIQANLDKLSSLISTASQVQNDFLDLTPITTQATCITDQLEATEQALATIFSTLTVCPVCERPL